MEDADGGAFAVADGVASLTKELERLTLILRRGFGAGADMLMPDQLDEE